MGNPSMDFDIATYFALLYAGYPVASAVMLLIYGLLLCLCSAALARWLVSVPVALLVAVLFAAADIGGGVWGKTLAMVLGAVGGYFAGYWVTAVLPGIATIITVIFAVLTLGDASAMPGPQAQVLLYVAIAIAATGIVLVAIYRAWIYVFVAWSACVGAAIVWWQGTRLWMMFTLQDGAAIMITDSDIWQGFYIMVPLAMLGSIVQIAWHRRRDPG